MEFFILNRSNYHKLISEEDEFYYPLIFQTPLLNARYVGKTAGLKIKGEKEKFSGLLLGVLSAPLISYFRNYFAANPQNLNSASLGLQDSEMDWLEAHLKITKHFSGIKFISKPAKDGPFYILLTERDDFLIFSCISETELEDLPEINYNKIIMNEAIEQLAGYLKARLPKKPKGRGGKSEKHGPSLEIKLKQLRISKFFRSAEEKVLEK
ncbi:MAG: hypothetical protein AABX01_02270 [Candidatus Micrarchaeota archaeon]